MPRATALACPASLKGVLSAREAAAALAEGFRSVGVEVDECPVADGGEGTAEVLRATRGGAWHSVVVSDPIGRPTDARWLELGDGTSVVEAAEAIGLGKLAAEELDPLHASSRGLGELILAATEGAERLVVCLGGVATVDGGAGLREVVHSLPSETTVLHDVRTELREAAHLYGPQKGATPPQVHVLEARLEAMSELSAVARLPGSGAAGGLGAALAVLGGRLVPGASFVLGRIGFLDRARAAALAVTGEGTVDLTTAEGKAPAEVVESCRRAGVPCVVFGGRVLEPLSDVENVALSGDLARAREDLVGLGRSLGGRLRAG